MNKLEKIAGCAISNYGPSLMAIGTFLGSYGVANYLLTNNSEGACYAISGLVIGAVGSFAEQMICKSFRKDFARFQADEIKSPQTLENLEIRP